MCVCVCVFRERVFGRVEDKKMIELIMKKRRI